MNIDSKQLASKPRKVGLTKSGKPVMQFATKGGWHMIVAQKGEGSNWETLGVGPHQAVARHIATKRNGDITWTELNKADHVDYAHFEILVPRYEAITNEFRKLHGD